MTHFFYRRTRFPSWKAKAYQAICFNEGTQYPVTGFHECPIWTFLKRQSKCKIFTSTHVISKNGMRLILLSRQYLVVVWRKEN